MASRVGLIAAAVGFAFLAAAEPPEAPPGPPRPNSSASPVPGSMRLLRIEEVRNELGTDDGQDAALDRLLADFDTEVLALTGGLGDGRGPLDMSPEERRAAAAEWSKKRREIDERTAPRLDAILTPGQRDRLGQLELRQYGPPAIALRPGIAEALGLTPDQKRRAGEALTAAGPGVPFEERKAKAAAGVLAVLTEEQKAKFEELQGRPLDLPEGGGSRRPIPRPGDGPAGGAGRPDRPAGDEVTGLLALNLLRTPGVRAELGINPEQNAALDRLDEAARAKLLPGGLIPVLSEEQRRSMTPEEVTAWRTDRANEGAELDQATAAGLDEVLTPPQWERLRQLRLQQDGPTAIVRRREVAAKLKLTPEQTRQVQELVIAASRQRPARGGPEETPEQRRARLAQAAESRAALEADILKVLSDEQRAAFEALQGEKFDFPAAAPRPRRQPET